MNLMVVMVYSDKCDGIDTCPGEGVCLKVCDLDAIEIVDGCPFVLDEACNNCGLCVMNCPNQAMSK